MQDECEIIEISKKLEEIESDGCFGDRGAVHKIACARLLMRLFFYSSFFSIFIFLFLVVLLLDVISPPSYFLDGKVRFPDSMLEFAQACLVFSAVMVFGFFVEIRGVMKRLGVSNSNEIYLQNYALSRGGFNYFLNLLYVVGKFDASTIEFSLLNYRGKLASKNKPLTIVGASVFSVFSIVVGVGFGYFLSVHAGEMKNGIIFVILDDKYFSLFVFLILFFVFIFAVCHVYKILSEIAGYEKQKKLEYIISLLECAVRQKSR